MIELDPENPVNREALISPNQPKSLDGAAHVRRLIARLRSVHASKVTTSFLREVAFGLERLAKHERELLVENSRLATAKQSAQAKVAALAEALLEAELADRDRVEVEADDQADEVAAGVLWCRHGELTDEGMCDACYRESDFAYDAAREAACFGGGRHRD